MGGTITEWRKPEIGLASKAGVGMAGEKGGGSGAVGQKGALLEYAWYNGSTVRWELQSEGGNRTRLLFTHCHVPGRQMVDAAKGWHYHLDLLALELDGAPMPHNPVALWDEITREATVRYNAAVAAVALEPAVVAGPEGHC